MYVCVCACIFQDEKIDQEEMAKEMANASR